MTKETNLAEAKNILKNDKVFLNENNRFNVSDYGKYRPNMTFVISNQFPIDKTGGQTSPLVFRSFYEYTDNMNIDFDGGAEVLFGNYHISKNNKPVFTVMDATSARDVLIRVNWGGAFDSSRGQTSEYASNIGATYFRSASSNGGGVGNDYYVVPVGFVAGMEDRDVSDILKTFQDNIEQENKEIEDAYLAFRKEKEESRNNKNSVMQKALPIVEKIKEIDSEYNFEPYDDCAKFGSYHMYKERYDDKLLEALNKDLESRVKMQERERKANVGRGEYLPKFEKIIKDLRLDEEKFCIDKVCYNYGKVPVFKTTLLKNPWGHPLQWEFNEDGYKDFVDKMKEYQQKREKEMEETHQKESELRYRGRLNDAYDAGYPGYEHWHRTGGATNLAKAWVVSDDGSIRTPDYNELRNPNHRFHTNWLETADGEQGYNQLLPGDMVVLYEKSCTKDPYHVTVEWCDGHATEDQVLTVLDVLKPLIESEFMVVDRNNISINDDKDVLNWLDTETNLIRVTCLVEIKGNIEKRSQARDSANTQDGENAPSEDDGLEL